MNDMAHISNGFVILVQYEDDGDVNTDGASLYAGPDDMNEEDYSLQDRELLEANYWFFNETITRWGYPL